MEFAVIYSSADSRRLTERFTQADDIDTATREAVDLAVGSEFVVLVRHRDFDPVAIAASETFASGYTFSGTLREPW